MIALDDNCGYAVYYTVLTGERKIGGSLLDDQKKLLSDPKKMAQLGFEQGIGFVSFGGIGYAGFKMLRRMIHHQCVPLRLGCWPEIPTQRPEKRS